MSNLFKDCDVEDKKIGKNMFSWAKFLFPINRSLTGNGNRQTLKFIKSFLPDLKIRQVGSGKKCFDWTVPMEWNVEEAYLINPDGEKIADFKENNLHLLGYSDPIDIYIDLKTLQKHLYSLEDQPNAIPYVTSYYKNRWGFCLKHKNRLKLKPGKYRAVIKTSKKKGWLNYGELYLPGKYKEEIFLSTYICHPSMANDQISGIVTLLALAKWIKQKSKRNYSFRIIWIPETIGAIVYLKKNLKILQKNIKLGWQLACLGDGGNFSFLPTREESTQTDLITEECLKKITKNPTKWSFLKRGSDERQWCFPGVDLPVCSIMRSKYNTYKEYHTSQDNLNLIRPQFLQESYNVLKYVIGVADENFIYKVNTIGEPQLGKLNLYPTIQSKKTSSSVENILNVITYCDGKTSSVEISKKINIDVKTVIQIQKVLLKFKKLKLKHL
ncbi:MAG: DUF4910 domain-containing protein [Spirochaetia bacterium]|nr:DUF4910 domain-containing protein [Spirochaetia bacterium]